MPTMTRERSNPAATKLSIAWIEGILDRKQISGSELAKRAGLATSTILRLINDPNHEFTPTLRTLQAVSTAVQEPIPEAILRAHNIGASQISRMSETERREQHEQLIARALGKDKAVQVSEAKTDTRKTKAPAPARQLTIRHVSSLPKSLQPSIRSRETVRCPFQLQDDADAFAFYQPDNTLSPFVQAGTLMYATQSVTPSIGDMALITSNDGRGRVRILKDISSAGIDLARSGTFDDAEHLDYDDIESIAVVVGTWAVKAGC